MYQGFFRDLQSIMGKLDYRTLRENVADEIRMKILNGDMKPGDKIIEQELASEFGISRGPVREALTSAGVRKVWWNIPVNVGMLLVTA